MIPFTDLNLQHKEIERDLDKAIKMVIKRGDFILGSDVELFEKEFAQFCNSHFAVGVGSGTEALFLALMSLGIKKGDEIIVPAFTYIATALAVSYTGARPIFVDIDEKAYNIDISKIKAAISKNTKAVIPVHLYGQPADILEILKIASDYNLKVIEDAAQAHGAAVKMADGSWQAAGSLADIGCFSFYPTKNLGGMGDGGMIVTNDERVYKRSLLLRDYGRTSKYEHKIIGYNSRLDTLQAAILRVKLKRLKAWNMMRQKTAAVYNDFLKGINGVITPCESPSVKHVYHVYAIRIKKRAELLQAFRREGISAIIHYPIPLHLQKAYKELGHKRGDFPIAEKVAGEILSLPMYPHLRWAQIKKICSIIKKVSNG